MFFFWALKITAQKNDAVFLNISKFPSSLITNVSSVTKDRNKFIWLSTQDGIFRFDSKTFLKIPVGVTPNEIKSWGAIKRLYYNSADNILFAISPDKGLAVLNSFYDVFFFQPLQLFKDDRTVEINSICHSGKFYIISTNRGLFVMQLTSDKKAKSYKPNIVFSKEDIIPLLTIKDSSFFLIFSSDKNLIKYSIDKKGTLKENSHVVIPKKIVFNELFSMSILQDLVLLGTDNGLFCFDPEKQTGNMTAFLQSNPVYAIAPDNNNFFVAAANGVYKLIDKKRLIKIEPNTTNLDENWLPLTYNLMIDEEHNLWLGTQNGLAMAKPEETAFFQVTNTSRDHRTLNYVYNIGAYGNDIFFSTEKGFYHLDVNYNLEPLFDSATFFLNFSGPGNQYLVSGLTETYCVVGHMLIPWHQIFSEFKKYKGLSFNDYEYYKDSLLFLSTENEKGVFIWNYKTKTISQPDYKTNKPGQIKQTNGLYRDKESLFILTDSVIYKHEIEKGTFQKIFIYDNDRVKMGLLFDMLKIGGKYYFASYDNGIICTDSLFRTLYIFNTTNGFSSNSVYRILPAGDSLLFVSTNQGINIINLKNNKVKRLTYDNGLHSNVFEEFSALKKDNKLFFGGKGGVTIINTDYINTPSSINYLTYLNYEMIDNKNNHSEFALSGKNKIKIPNTITQVKINFQNIIYPFNSQNKYYYKISELNPNWIGIGGQNSVSLIGLSPGTYHFQVQAFNEDGVPSEIKELTLIFLPKWYQTWWFKALIALSIIVIGYGFYRLRINQLKKEQSIRTKLASDLHDDLGSTMNSVKVYTNLAIMEQQQEKYLFKIKESTQEAITGIRDIIWVLDDSKDSIEHLLSRISLFASPLCEANDILYKQEISDEARDHKLGQEERRNLYMMLKEAVNNAVKYSGGKTIEIEVSVKKGKPTIQIEDDGKGFDTKLASEGNGLKNMKRRAMEIKYHIQIESADYSGTTISFQKV